MRSYLIIILFSSLAYSQLSNKHWLSPITPRSLSLAGEHYLYLSTPENTPFTVKVTIGNGTEILGSPFTISKNSPKTIFIGNSTDSPMHRSTPNAFSNNYGLILEGGREFYATFKIKTENHSEIIVSKGVTALGTDFKIGSLPQPFRTSNGNFMTSVMATENNTLLNIYNYNNDVVFQTGVGPISPNTQTILLNAGYSIVFVGNCDIFPNLDGFVGASLSSNKPVTVITGNAIGGMSNEAGGQDYNLDQIVPVEQVGSEYILIKGNGSDETEHPLVIATEDNTQVFINGNSTSLYNLNSGEYALIPSSYYQGTTNKNIYVSSDKPIYMYQITGGAISDATSSFNYIPPLSCFFKRKVEIIPSISKIGSSDYTAEILILAYINSVIKINGIITTSIPEPVIGNLNWVTYKVSGYSGNINIESTGPILAGILGTNGLDAGYSGFYSGYGNEPKDTSAIICSVGTTNLLEEIDGNPQSGGIWTPSLASGTDVFNPSVDFPGVYNYYHINDCDIVDVNITITLQQAPYAGNDTSITLCQSDSSFDLTELLGDNVDPSGLWTPELSSGSNIYNPNIDGSGLFVYSIDNNNFICNSSAGITITNNPYPIISNIDDYVLCDNNIDNDDSNGFVTFDLSSKNFEIINGQTNIDITYFTSLINAKNNSNPIINYYTDNTDVYVKLTNNLTNCSDIAKFRLIVKQLPIINDTVSLYQCDVDSDGTTEFNLTQANAYISLDANISFTYFNSLTDAQNNLLPITNFDNFSSTNNNIVWAKVTDGEGCFKIAKINLVVSSTQIPTNYNYQIVECDTFIDNNDPATDGIAYFSFSDATIDILGQLPSSQNLNVYYYQNQQDALLEQNEINNLTNYRNTNSPYNQIIWVRIESLINNDCVGLGPYLTLIVNPSPYFNLGDDIVVCVDPISGQNNTIINLNATPSIIGNYIYQWLPTNPNLDSNGNQSSIFNNVNEGVYSVIVTDNSSNCTYSDSVEVVFSSEPQNVIVNLTTPFFSAGTSSIIVTVGGGYGDYEYSINNGEEWQVSPIFIGLTNGMYTILVRDIAQCGLKVSESIQTITYPSYFTPNGDGFNEYWNINNLPQNYNAIITIYDRYGKLLKQIKPNQAGWDGSFNGYLLPSTDYWFKIEYTENGSRKEFKSHFALKR